MVEVGRVLFLLFLCFDSHFTAATPAPIVAMTPQQSSPLEILRQGLLNFLNTQVATRGDPMAGVQVPDPLNGYGIIELFTTVLVVLFFVLFNHDKTSNSLALFRRNSCKPVEYANFDAEEVFFTATEELPQLKSKFAFYLIEDDTGDFKLIPRQLAPPRSTGQVNWAFLIMESSDPDILPGDILIRARCKHLTSDVTVPPGRALANALKHAAYGQSALRNAFFLTVLRPKASGKFCSPNLRSIDSDPENPVCCGDKVLVDPVSNILTPQTPGTTCSKKFGNVGRLLFLEQAQSAVLTDMLLKHGKATDSGSYEVIEVDDDESDLEEPLSKAEEMFKDLLRSGSKPSMVFLKYAIGIAFGIFSVKVPFMTPRLGEKQEKIENMFLIATVVFAAFAILWFGMVAVMNSRMRSHMKKEDREMNYGLFNQFMLILCVLVPANIMMIARKQSSNTDAQHVIGISFVFNYLGLFLSVLFVIDSLFNLLRNRFDVPLPKLMPDDFANLVLGFVGVGAAISGFWDQMRAVHGNGGYCNVTKLEDVMSKVTRPTPIVVICETMLKEIGDAGVCNVRCSNELVRPVMCADQGLPGAEWTIIVEASAAKFCCHPIQCQAQQTYCPNKCDELSNGCFDTATMKLTPEECGNTPTTPGPVANLDH